MTYEPTDEDVALVAEAFGHGYCLGCARNALTDAIPIIEREKTAGLRGEHPTWSAHRCRPNPLPHQQPGLHHACRVESDQVARPHHLPHRVERLTNPVIQSLNTGRK